MRSSVINYLQRLDERPLPTPQIQFRTLNGYHFWAVPLPPEALETEALRIRRAFEVCAPGGEAHPVAVDVTMSVRSEVREIAGREFEPWDPLWDTVCRAALCLYLWEYTELPPEILPVYGLSREQIQTVRAMAGMSPARLVE